MGIATSSEEIEGLIKGEKAGLNHIEILLQALDMGDRRKLWMPSHFLRFHAKLFPFGGSLRDTSMCFARGSFHSYADPHEVPMWTRLETFCKSLKLKRNWKLLAQHHLEFCIIHPFDDGNGRMARIFSNWEAKYVGFGALRICADYRSRYIAAL